MGRVRTSSAPVCSRLMSSRLSTSAASLSSDSSAVSSSSSRSSADHSTSRLSRLVTTALTVASGVRRSWPTAASSAVRILLASASGAACGRRLGQPLPLQHDGRLRRERADEPLVVGVQRPPLQGERELVAHRDDGVRLVRPWARRVAGEGHHGPGRRPARAPGRRRRAPHRSARAASPTSGRTPRGPDPAARSARPPRAGHCPRASPSSPTRRSHGRPGACAGRRGRPRS